MMNYFTLLLVESIGAIIVIVVGMPLYLTLMKSIEQYQGDGSKALLGFIAVIIMQSAHWLKESKEFKPRVVHSKFLGRLVSFCGLLAFIVPSALFSVIFFIRFEEVNMTPFKTMVMLLVLFSMFCYTRDLEELARAFHKKNA